MCDIRDISQVLAVISTAFPNFKLAEHTPDIYLELLGDIPAAELKAAVLHCCSEQGRAFAPSVGEIRGAVASVRRVQSGIPSSYQAWEEVRRAMIEVGSYNTPVWSHPLVGQAVAVIGWRNLCLSEYPSSDRMRFIEAYEQLTKRAEDEEMMLPQVRAYITDNRAALLDVTAEIRRLAEGKRA